MIKEPSIRRAVYRPVHVVLDSMLGDVFMAHSIQ